MKPHSKELSRVKEKKALFQDDPYKLSIHTSSNFDKSQTESKRQNLSRMLQNSRRKISMRKAGQLFSSKVRPKSSKVVRRSQNVQFDNIKWISIISAYDPSRLQHVSVAKKSCQNFLKNQGPNIKKDSRSNLYFNDLIKSFKQRLNKIQIQYFYIMNKFLYSQRSVNSILIQMRPQLDQVIEDTAHMQQKLQDCLNTYQHHQFRQLLRKFKVALQKSRQIQDIIMVVNKSKHKIDMLFQKFDDDRKIQEKINKVKEEGIHEVRRIVADHNQIALQNKIMDKFQKAINQMTEKSGQAYRKIRGVKELIDRFKYSQNQSDQALNKIDMNAISLIGKVCKQICMQAQAFQGFSQKFLIQGDIINEDLKNVIKKYGQDIAYEQKKAIELQTKFLIIIFAQTIKKLKQNSKIAVVYQNAKQHHDQYRKILRMIEDIADCLTDQNKIVSIQKLVKETKTIFDRLYDQIKYIRQNKKFEQIDTQQGLISILQVSKLIKQYKQKIHLIRNKFQMHNRELCFPSVKIDQVNADEQIQFVNQIVALSKKINNSNLSARISQIQCFSHISNAGLQKMSKQIQIEKILQPLSEISTQFLKLQQKNILQKYFGSLKLQNLVFKEAFMMWNLKTLSNRTNEKNLIPQLQQVFKKRNQWQSKHSQTSQYFKRYFDRILAKTLVKGFKSQDILQIDNPQKIVFPTRDMHIQTLKTKVKYREVLLNLIQSSAVNKQQNNKLKFNSSAILQRNIAVIHDFIKSYRKINQIKKNHNSQTYIAKQMIFQFCERLFSEVFFTKKDHNSKIESIFGSFIQIIKAKVLSLTRKVLNEEIQWKQRNASKQVASRQVENKSIPPHIRKIMEILQIYKQRHSKLLENMQKALKQFKKPMKNVQNSQQEVSQYLKLSLYSKTLLYLVNFCKDTQQIVHTILDNQKNPIALLNPTSNLLKQIFKGLKKGKQLTQNQVNKLVFKAAKVGIQIKNIQDIKNKVQNNKKQNLNKCNKQKTNNQMQQQIAQASQNYGQQFDEQINQQQSQMAEQQMAEQEMGEQQMAEQQFGQQINQQEPQQQMNEQYQQPAQQLIDEVEEQKIEDIQDLDELIEESSNIHKSKAKNNKSIQNKSKNHIDDFQEFQQEIPAQKNNKNQKLNNQKQKQKQLKQQKQKPNKKEQQQKIKQQEEKAKKQKQLKLKKQHILFSQTQLPKNVINRSIYEVFSFISSLNQLKNIILYVNEFQSNYVSNHLDWSKIQQHFNDHYLQSEQDQTKQLALQQKQKNKVTLQSTVQKYVSSLDQNVQNRLKQDFKQQTNVLNELKNFEQIKNVKKNLLLLKNSNWQVLEAILKKNKISYNILKNPFGNKNLYVSILRKNTNKQLKDQQKPTNKYDQYGSIHGYLTKNFRFYKRNIFNLQQYVQKCFTKSNILQKSHQIIIYQVKDQKSLIRNVPQSQSLYQKLSEIIQNFTNGASDIVNKFDLCLSLYKKSLNIVEKIDLDMSWYQQQIKFLQNNATEQTNFLSYFNKISENVKNAIKKTKSLESKLQNIIFKCCKENIFECIEQLAEVYGQQITKKVKLQNSKKSNIALIFDRKNVNSNLQKINNILSKQTKDNQSIVQKTILSLLDCDNILDGDSTVQAVKCFQNAQKIKKVEQKILLQIFELFRINHSYIFIAGKGDSKYFTLNDSKDKCISQYLKMYIQPLKIKLNSSLLKNHSYFQPLNSLLNSSQPSLYKSILNSSKLQNLFKQRINQTKLFSQTQIVINQQVFNFQNGWQRQNQNRFDNIVNLIENQKNQLTLMFNRIQNQNNLNPCQYIYQKFLSSPKNQVTQIWQQYIRRFEQIRLEGNNHLKQGNWLLFINSIYSQIKDSLVESSQSTIMFIKNLISIQQPINSFQQLFQQIKETYEWLKNANQNQNQIKDQNQRKFTVFVIKSQTKNKFQYKIVFFYLTNQTFKFQNFSRYFSFLQSTTKDLLELFFTFLTQSIQLQNDQQIKQQFSLTSQDTLYLIDQNKLSRSLNGHLQYLSSKQYFKKRQKIICQYVRLYNKIYFISKTTGQIDFQKQIAKLYNIQSRLKQSIHQAQVGYQIRSFIEHYKKQFRGIQSIQKCKKVIVQKLEANQKVLEEDIPKIYKEIDDIGIQLQTCCLDSYDKFFSWFYNTVKNLLELPFYNLIAPTFVDPKSKQTINQFLGVIMSQNSYKSGQTDRQISQCLKQMLIIFDYKPIYQRLDILTIELKKLPAFLQFQSVKGVSVNQMITYLLNNKSNSQSNQKKDWYLRIDKIRKINEDRQQRKLLKLIRLQQFLKQPMQQFNLQITIQNLTNNIQINIGSFMKTNQLQLQQVEKKLVIECGFDIQINEKVYIGKKIILTKLSHWLHQIFIQDQVNKKIKQQLLQFYNTFTKQFLEVDVPKEQREDVGSLLKKVKASELLDGQIPLPTKQLILTSSHNIIKSAMSCFKRQKVKLYQSIQNYQRNYDKHFRQFQQNFKNSFTSILLDVQNQININLETQIMKKYKLQIIKIEQQNIRKYYWQNNNQTKQEHKQKQNQPIKTPQQQNIIQSVQKNQNTKNQQQSNALKKNQNTKSKQQLIALKKNNFFDYLVMKINNLKQGFQQGQYNQPFNEIFDYFQVNKQISDLELSIILEKIFKRIKKIINNQTIIESKELSFQKAIKQPKYLPIFLYLLCNSSSFDYLRLFATQFVKKQQVNQPINSIKGQTNKIQKTEIINKQTNQVNHLSKSQIHKNDLNGVKTEEKLNKFQGNQLDKTLNCKEKKS